MLLSASRPAARRVLSALAASALLTAPALAQSPPAVLSPKDASAYAAAFAAVRAGDFDAAAPKVKDKSLLGRLAYLKLMHPAYHAEFDELKAWLAKYKDQPDADKVFILAKKRSPGAALEPPESDPGAALALAPSDAGLTKPKVSIDPKLQGAREAFYNTGDVAAAYALAVKSGERWVAGMAAYRLGRYGEAMTRFAGVAHDRSLNEWDRSRAGFWAARAAVADGEPQKAVEYLRLAARTPYTFYGLIAERQLGLDPAVNAEGYDPGEEEAVDEAAPASRQAQAPTYSAKAAMKFICADKRAHRAAAFAQIGDKVDEAEELRLALAASGSDKARAAWRALAQTLGAPLSGPAAAPARRTRFDLSDYQTLPMEPLGGYTLERALIYAIIRQESHFNPSAASASGAYGLMQMTPATAAYNAGVDRKSIDASLLLDPATNMRLGQDYVYHLLGQTQGDILLTVAAYNAGPRGVNKLAAALPDADSLLLIESLAGAETRDFVQRVMSNYWIYRQLFHQPSPTLDATASGAKLILAAWDQTAAALTDAPPAPTPPSAPASLGSAAAISPLAPTH